MTRRSPTSHQPAQPSARVLGLSRRGFLGAGSVMLLEGLHLGSAAVLSGCDDYRTSGERIRVETRVESDLSRGQAYTNALGWTIELDRARFGLAQLSYLLSEPATLALKQHPRGHKALLRQVLLPEAHAHPGHDVDGEVIAEMPEPHSVDLLERAQSLGAFDGVTGDARSANVELGSLGAEPLDGETAGDQVIELAGTAHHEDSAVSFFAVITPEDFSGSTETAPLVRGCPFEGPIDGDGVVTLQVQLSVWLEQMNFAELALTTEERFFLTGGSATPGATAHNALVRGVRKAAAYRFRFERRS